MLKLFINLKINRNAQSNNQMEGEGQRKKIVCTVCHLMYDRYKHEPLVISPCSHTFCRECITSLELKACRICNSEIKTKNTNWALLDILPLSEYELKKQKVEGNKVPIERKQQ